MPQVAHEAREALASDPHLEGIFAHVDLLDEQLHDPSLLGGEQLAPAPSPCYEVNNSPPPWNLTWGKAAALFRGWSTNPTLSEG
jgi:hypothetical protein